jgi:FKBP-type peptidyl-prolyl cis-trans isomerase FklB
MRIFSATQGVAVLSLTVATWALPVHASDYEPTTDAQRFSYAIGFQIGARMAQQFNADELEIDADALTAAIRDVLTETDPAMSLEAMQQAMQKVQQEQMAALAAEAKANADRGLEFRDEYAKRDGVQATESGIHYRVLETGDGDSPTADDTVVVHYQGALIDGTEFDSSYNRGEPATFALEGIIEGWREILQLMRAGAKWEVVIPPELAYGERGAGGAIGPNSTLVFEIELIEIK